MATDYDAPRRTETDEVPEDSLEELTARRNEAQSAVVDVDESSRPKTSSCPAPTCPARSLGARGAEAGRRVHLLELFSAHHRSRLASEKDGEMMICTDCAA